MNKKNYILNNADTRYFEYFFLRRLRYGKSIVVHVDEEGTDYSVTIPKDASFDAIKLKGDTVQTGTPTPETPATIKTVSGEQVIKINKTSYNINLGSIELCKINNFQDYIYKDGDDWYVHKEFGKVDLSTLSWDENKYNNCYIRRNTVIPNIKYVPNNRTLGVALAEKYILRIGSGASGNDAINHIMIDVNAVAVNTGTVSNIPVTGLFYYQLATPTNTKITDSTLISQLNALFASGLKSGVNTIKVTAPSGLLPTIFNIIINH